MFTTIGKKIALAGILSSLAAVGSVATAAGPIESNETQNQQGLKNTLTGAEERPQFNGGQNQSGATRQNSAAPQRVVANKPVMENALRPADHEIAEWLMVCNNEEVQLAKLAEQHADHQKVKDFAHQMQTEHTKAWQQLEQIAQRARQQQFAGRQATGQQSNGTTVNAAGTPVATHRGEAANGREEGGLNYLEIHKQVAAQCIASANKDMAAKKGAEFDKAFIGSQIGAHYRLIDTNRVLREYASPELRKSLDEETKTAEHHLAEAQSIMKSLEQK